MSIKQPRKPKQIQQSPSEIKNRIQSNLRTLISPFHETLSALTSQEEGEIDNQIKKAIQNHDEVFIRKITLLSEGKSNHSAKTIYSKESTKLQQLSNRHVLLQRKHLIHSNRHWHQGMYDMFDLYVKNSKKNWYEVHQLLVRKIKESCRKSKKQNTANPWMYRVSRNDNFIYKELYIHLTQIFIPSENMTDNKELRKNLQKDLLSYCSTRDKKSIYDLSSILKSYGRKLNTKRNRANNELVSKIIIRIYCCLLYLSEEANIALDILNNTDNPIQYKLTEKNIDEKTKLLNSIWCWVNMDDRLDSATSMHCIKKTLKAKTSSALYPHALTILLTQTASLPNLMTIQTIGLKETAIINIIKKNTVNDLKLLLAEFYLFLLTESSADTREVIQTIIKYEDLKNTKRQYKKTAYWNKIIQFLDSLSHLWINHQESFFHQQLLDEEIKMKTSILMDFLSRVKLMVNRNTSNQTLHILLFMLNIKTPDSQHLFINDPHPLTDSIYELITLKYKHIENQIDLSYEDKQDHLFWFKYINPKLSLREIKSTVHDYFTEDTLFNLMNKNIDKFIKSLSFNLLTFTKSPSASSTLTYKIIMNLLINNSHIRVPAEITPPNWMSCLIELTDMLELQPNLIKLNIFSNPTSSFWLKVQNYFIQSLFNEITDSLKDTNKAISYKITLNSIGIDKEALIVLFLSQIRKDNPSHQKNEAKLKKAILDTLSQNHLKKGDKDRNDLIQTYAILNLISYELNKKIKPKQKAESSTSNLPTYLQSIIADLILSKEIMKELPRFNIVKTLNDITQVGIDNVIRKILLNNTPDSKSTTQATVALYKTEPRIQEISKNILLSMIPTMKQNEELSWLEAFDTFCTKHPNFILCNNKISMLTKIINDSLKDTVNETLTAENIKSQISLASEVLFSDLNLHIQNLSTKKRDFTPKSQWQIPFIYATMYDNEHGIDLDEEFHRKVSEFTNDLISLINKNNANPAYMTDINIIISNYAMIFSTIHKTLSTKQPSTDVAATITRMLIQINSSITPPKNKTLITQSNQWMLIAEMTKLCEQSNIIRLVTTASNQIPNVHLSCLKYTLIQLHRESQKSPGIESSQQFHSEDATKLRRSPSQAEIYHSFF